MRIYFSPDDYIYLTAKMFTCSAYVCQSVAVYTAPNMVMSLPASNDTTLGLCRGITRSLMTRDDVTHH